MKLTAEKYIPGLGSKFFIDPAYVTSGGKAKNYIPGLGDEFIIPGSFIDPKGGIEEYIPGANNDFTFDITDVLYSSLPTVIALGSETPGVNTVSVTGANYLTVLTLYDSSDAVVATAALVGDQTSYTFTEVTTGTGYYVVQSLNGVVALSSDTTSVA